MIASVDYSECVRSSCKAGACLKCVQACTLNAIAISDGLPVVSAELCSSCAACVSVCPTDAVRGFEPLKAVFEWLESADECFSCVSSRLCAAALSVEQMVSVCLMRNGATFIDMSGCDECTHLNPCKAAILSRINETNELLQALGSANRVQTKLDSPSPDSWDKTVDRRDFFRAFGLKPALRSAKYIESKASSVQEIRQRSVENIDYKELRRKSVTPSRQLLLTNIQKLPLSGVGAKSMELSFASLKFIDSTCTNCGFCVNLCPSGALSYNRLKNKISFEAKNCLNCHLCIDACESKSIHAMPFVISDFWASVPAELIAFKVGRCDACGAVFTPLKDEESCIRCTLEYEDALELTGL